MPTLRSFENNLRDGLLSPGGIVRQKAKPEHPLEILTEISDPGGFVYLIVGYLCQRFQTVNEAMTFIENYWEEQNREERRKAEYQEDPALLTFMLTHTIDEWTEVH